MPRWPLPMPGIDVPAGPLLRVLPLRKSLRLPSFWGGDENGESSCRDPLSLCSVAIPYVVATLIVVL
jgi:hypothetical protein